MRVALIATWFPGAARPTEGVFVREHARAVARVADVAVVHPEPEPATGRAPWTVAHAIEDGLPVLRVRVRRTGKPAVDAGVQALAVRAALRRLPRPDVLHAHVFLGGLLALAARPRGVPVVVTEHLSSLPLGELSPLEARTARAVYARADLVAPVSESLAGAVRELAPGARVEVVPNAVDAERFTPRAGPREPGPMRLLVVAGLTAVKQVDVLLDALARPDAPAARLTVAGEGPDRAALEARAAALGVDARFAGRQDADAVAALLRDADVLVLPSRWETLGVVLVEAMAAGVPVVASRVGGVPEVVDDAAGVLVEPGDPAALARALAGMAGRLGAFDPQALHERAAARYGLDAIGARWLAIYERLLGSRAISRAQS